MLTVVIIIVVNHHVNEGKGSCKRVGLYSRFTYKVASCWLAMKLLITTTLVSHHRRVRLKMM